nr:hypothetical protein [Burkholderia ambifaria]
MRERRKTFIHCIPFLARIAPRQDQVSKQQAQAQLAKARGGDDVR